MRHRKSLRKFSRTPAHRRSMMRSLATSFLEQGKLETTVAKAKDLRRVAEKLITLGGEDTLHRRRHAYSYLQSKPVVHKLFVEIGPRYLKRPGGYTRITRTRLRAGDKAELAVIELVQDEYKAAKPEAKKPRSQKNISTKAKSDSKDKILKAEQQKEESPELEEKPKEKIKKELSEVTGKDTAED